MCIFRFICISYVIISFFALGHSVKSSSGGNMKMNSVPSTKPLYDKLAPKPTKISEHVAEPVEVVERSQVSRCAGCYP